MRNLGPLAAAAALLCGFECSRRFNVDAEDVVIEPPSQSQLEIWQRQYEGGTTWLGDPKRVAHEEIQLRLDVPWKGESFDPAKYQFTESNPEKPEWGSYAIRRYVDSGGRLVSYQVQMSRYRAIWYARKVRHYFGVDLAHPALEDRGPAIH
jgi:hypothetical protein